MASGDTVLSLTCAVGPVSDNVTYYLGSVQSETLEESLVSGSTFVGVKHSDSAAVTKLLDPSKSYTVLIKEV